MNPFCPSCLAEMSKTSSSRNMFRCEPCREIIQFFDVRKDRDTIADAAHRRSQTKDGGRRPPTPPRQIKRPIDRAA